MPLHNYPCSSRFENIEKKETISHRQRMGVKVRFTKANSRTM